ncbi:hypothetical protein [Homoserinibacter sp. GY 40078]|uniref:hypothetical protein n=1 Tax=Homoserinibacter sp. GY 40078 TaxID=2603275 RepID=UPI0011CAB822|nr:hypothetical protein [Homoserinibacter sp. GY 40078]TXK17647.1 hypothetical protein FVQ89_12630 [Homoserinibacter sp. GY 40078]
MYPDFSSVLGAGVTFLVIYLVVCAGVVILGIWLTYTIIWRAVRRGLYEYHHPRPTRASRAMGDRVQGPRDW